MLSADSLCKQFKPQVNIQPDLGSTIWHSGYKYSFKNFLKLFILKKNSADAWPPPPSKKKEYKKNTQLHKIQRDQKAFFVKFHGFNPLPHRDAF